MSKPLKIGVTGGIGSGKSMFCRIFEALGCPVYYADDRAKQLLIEDQGVKEQIVKLFGEESYHEGQLDRAYLADRVFSNEEELAKMNQIVHPAVAKDFERFVEGHSKAKMIIKEAALLFETGSYQQLDHTIAVLAKKEVRMNRVLLRDTQRSKAQVEHIMANQTSDAQRRKLADWVIDNDGEQLVIPQVMQVFNSLDHH